MKKYFLLILIFISFITSGYVKPDVYKIDAEKNAFFHNNMGLRWLNEKCYYAAIQEFKIAISLAEKTQATAIYYKNLGDTYTKIGHPDWALDCYKKALNINPMNFQLYQDLAQCYKLLGIAKQQMQNYKNNKDPFNPVMIGLLKIKTGDLKGGVITLDAFTNSEPDLLITPAIRQYVQEKIKEINSK